ncbi:HTH-like domain-containing protein [Rhodovulum kholense]|uniref:HTH-like domain-containing protein n=1 Tax=Rhodovulum kholense TaxID=453584 RepID=A0A8E3AQ54_9RHOB|nr:hypothetical protein [Rhodovulum kholense]PTW47797.1 hypothetical protein C8N38_109155 [Rhodovulum kholense]
MEDHMQVHELASILSKGYLSAAPGEAVLSIHLFGIRYAEELKGHSLPEILALADLPKSYGTEIRKGMRLAEYVEIRT